ncbi:efflux RND transporter periplasmic adaptor subunit [Herminiimonas fonticola]|uniref:RND family efflux transporter MFP subunit n=1 Tax=Herminiimonas fonticola TaxID=303380 RepID=A0A4R6G857_9BURK|nr:efflux RND transporter periplasmic adaptor subunit [Herminiimonas fonticola]RBA23965.1 efflux transporter, RND family, MFP subunit [Herminiimonas fonticola]TDN89965.1 RND family efflux transporter MFP subunit [Herminiimonas fonticola]
MQQTKKYLLIGAAVVVLGGVAYLGLRAPAEHGKKSDNVQIVKTAIAEQKTIPIKVLANGYVTAINTVDVRPKVQNIVRTIHVKEGQFVKAGQLLFTLDERSDQSNVAKARAELAASQSDLADAELTLKRNEDLLARNFVSKAVVDTSRNKVESLRNTVKANQAITESGNVALSDNRIEASISGRIGIISVHPGSLAQPSGDAMVTISQLDPIAVSFTLPERELANITATYPQGNAPVKVQLPGQPEVTGKLIFIDNTADTQSGTIRMKAQFDNAAQKLWPGTFVSVNMISRNVADAVLVPAQAVVTGPEYKFIYVVQADDTVKEQKIEVVAIEEGQAAVTGLVANARVVVEGTQNLRAGSKISEAKDKSPAGAKPSVAPVH